MAASKPSIPASKHVPANTKPKTLEQSKIAFKVVKPTPNSSPQKRKKAFGKKYLEALQRPVQPFGQRYPLTIQADGLLCLETTPEYLFKAEQRNDKDSPLLRLPDKIRVKIWEYALGGMMIEIRLRTAEVTTPVSGSEAIEDTGIKTESVKDDDPSSFAQNEGNRFQKPAAATPRCKSAKSIKTKTSNTSPPLSPFTYTLRTPIPTRKTQNTAHALSPLLTSRKIYLETRLLPYTLSTFIFPGSLPSSFCGEDGPDGALEGWASDRCPAQRKAIRCIRPHWMDMVRYIQRDNRLAFTHMFPGLKRIVVAKRAVGGEAKWAEVGDPMRAIYREGARKVIKERVLGQEGAGVEVVF